MILIFVSKTNYKNYYIIQIEVIQHSLDIITISDD